MKKHPKLPLLGLSFVLLFQVSPGIGQDGLDFVLEDEPDIYWTMGRLTDDELAVAPEFGEDSNGNPLDGVFDSGFGVDPTLVDGIVPASTDGAILFDASEEQSLMLADSPNTNNVPGNPGVINRTYELWFQPRNLPETGEDNRQIIYEEGGTTRGLAIYLDGTEDGDPTEANLYIMTTNLAEEVWGGTTGPFETDPDYAVSTTVQKDQLYHLVFVIDKPDDIREDLNGNLIGYLNGQEFGRVEEVGVWYNHTDDAGIGGPYADTVFHDGIVSGAGGSGLYHFDGIIDEFAIYDEVSLSAERILEHYQRGSGQAEVFIEDFTASAEMVDVGAPLTLSWKVVDGLEELTINNDVGSVLDKTTDGSGETVVNPTESTTYTLTATKNDSSQSKSVSVFVGAPVVAEFTASPNTIRSGDTSTLSWRLQGASSFKIEPDPGNIEGNSVDVTPDDTTKYVITATNDFGSTTAEVTVTVISGLVPDLSWTAADFEDGAVDVWDPAINATPNDGITFEGGLGGEAQSGATNFPAISKWINSPGYNLTGPPADSWQDALGNAITQENVSWELIFRPGDFEGTHTLFNTGGNGDGTAIVLTDSELDFRFQDANNDDQRVIAPVDLSTLGAATDFFHVVGLADVESDTLGTASIYVNGVLQGEPVESFGDINDWDGGDLAELGKGNNIPGGNPFNPDDFDGDIALFNYYGGIILSDEQIQQLFQTNTGGGTPSGGFSITQIQYIPAETAVELTWTSSPGKSYAVDASTSLLPDEWEELADGVPAADEGNETTYKDAFSENNPMPAAQYYRIRQE